jgi:hypothetical protein
MKTLIALLAIAVAAQQTSADQPTGAALRGDHYQLAAAKTYNMHAHDHARLLGKYAAAAAEPIPSAVIKQHAAAIRTNTDLARKSFAGLSAASRKDPAVSKQLAEIDKRLAKLNQLIGLLDAQSKRNTTETQVIKTETDAIAQELKATHTASKAIDQALLRAAGRVANRIAPDRQFDDSQSPDYYFTGEGHFLD